MATDDLRLVCDAAEKAAHWAHLFADTDTDMRQSADRIRAAVARLRGETRCAKCCGTDIHLRFAAKGREVSIGGFLYFRDDDVRWGNIPSGLRNDHGKLVTMRDVMLHTCRRCGWWWTSEPRDSAPAERAAEGPGPDSNRAPDWQVERARHQESNATD